jgi:hypothetical protein
MSIRWNKRFLLFTAILGPIIFFIYTAFIVPRPYYIREMDLEPDYFYNSLMLFKGNPLPGIHHPGTPIYYLGALLMRIIGDPINDAQQFFNLSYMVIALVTVASLIFFVRIVLKDTPIGVSALSLISLMVWPPFLTFSNHFGSESFILAFGLLTITIFWMSLSSSGRTRKWLLFICGIGTGLCLATKMTFLPLAVAFGVSSFLGAFWGEREESLSPGKPLYILAISEAVGRLVRLMLGTIASFLVFTEPIFSRIPHVIYQTLSRPEARLSSSFVTSFLSVYHYLFDANATYAIIVVIALALFCMAFIKEFSPIVGNRKRTVFNVKANEDKFDCVTGGFFLALMAFAFCYCLATSYSVVMGYEAGIGLRNASPTALFVPFIIVYTWRTLGRNLQGENRSQKSVQWVLFLLATLMIVSGLSYHLSRRSTFIEGQTRAIASAERYISPMIAPNTRIAVDNGPSNDIVGGEADFHFFGNHRYAYDYFDDDLLMKFPAYTRFYTMFVVQPEGNINNSNSNSNSKYGVIGDAIWKIINGPEQFIRPNQQIVGEAEHIKVSAIIIQKGELERIVKVMRSDRSITFNDLLEIIKSKTGFKQIHIRQIGGADCVIFLPADSTTIDG